MDRSEFLDRFLDLLRAHQIRFCVIGGQGANAYAEPVVSLDLDLVVASPDLSRLEQALVDARLSTERFAHSLNVSDSGSDLRVQIQLDQRYASFAEGATERDVLGERMPVARIEDVLQGKVWAALDRSGARASA